MDLSILQIASLTAPTSLAIIVFILWKSGLLGALANRWGSNGTYNRIRELEDFKELAESNHFHDLENARQDIKELRQNLYDLSIRMTIIETQLKIK